MVALDGGMAKARVKTCTAIEGVVLVRMANALWDSWRWHRVCPVRGSVRVARWLRWFAVGAVWGGRGCSTTANPKSSHTACPPCHPFPTQASAQQTSGGGGVPPREG